MRCDECGGIMSAIDHDYNQTLYQCGDCGERAIQ